MKRNLFTVVVCVLLLFCCINIAHARKSYSGGYGTGGTYKSHTVRPHIRKDGTYVGPSRRTNPDRSKTNNYGSRGNYNPYTGKEGTKDPYSPNDPSK